MSSKVDKGFETDQILPGLSEGGWGSAGRVTWEGSLWWKRSAQQLLRHFFFMSSAPEVWENDCETTQTVREEDGESAYDHDVPRQRLRIIWDAGVT